MTGAATASTQLTSVPVSDAIIRGRSRALPFHRNLDGEQPAPGAVFYMDGAGPLIPSFPDGYVSYCVAVDAGSGFGRIWPSHRAQEVIFIRELLIDLGFSIDGASVINSKSAVGMAFDPVAFKKTKHILRAAEFLRDLVTREVVSVEHISGAVMLADILTKAASRGVFVDLIKQLDSFA